MTRIVVISDTHGRHNGLVLPEGDILIHCGDFCSRGTFVDAINFINWFNTQPFKHKVFIAGNHDLVFEQGGPGAVDVLMGSLGSNTYYLQDSGRVIEGLNFWGSPVQPRFFNWAFNRDRGEDIKKHWDLIPPEIDVLITHGPPHKICDAVVRYGLPDENCGCEVLRETTKRIQPKLHVFGHIHYSGGQIVKENGTIFANASILDEQYQVFQKPLVFDVDKNKVVNIINIL